MWRSGAAILAAVMLMTAPGAVAKPIAGAAANAGGFRTGPDGSVTHEPTGTRFPAAADGFVRTSTRSLDPTGKYPVVTYERGTGARKSVARIALVLVGAVLTWFFCSMAMAGRMLRIRSTSGRATLSRNMRA